MNLDHFRDCMDRGLTYVMVTVAVLGVGGLWCSCAFQVLHPKRRADLMEISVFVAPFFFGLVFLVGWITG